MADGTKIEWTDATWNPLTGCSIRSPGCITCYAMTLAGTRLKNHPSRMGLTQDTKAGPVWTGEIRFNEQWLAQPLFWRRPRMVFVCAHSDLFHEKVSDGWLDQILAVMALAPQHTYQVLTKRDLHMLDYLGRDETPGRIALAAERLYYETLGPNHPKGCLIPSYSTEGGDFFAELSEWPLPNVWLGVSIEDQVRADERRDALAELARQGWLTWVSYEPALGPVDWTGWEFIRWLVSGGESDTDGKSARHTLPEWHRAARDFCASQGIAYLFKQWGCWIDADQIAARLAAMTEAETGYLVRDGAVWKPSLPLNFGDAEWLAKTLGHKTFEHHSDGRTLIRMKKSDAGRLLDGVEHNGYPVT